MTTYQYAIVDGHKIFYREAGPKNAPTILLLHGFPTSSHMFRNLFLPSMIATMWSHPTSRDSAFRMHRIADGFTIRLSTWPRSSILRADYRSRSLRDLCLRLRSARGSAARVGSSGADHRDRFSKRQRLRRGAEPRLEPDSEILEGADIGTTALHLREFLTPEATKSQYLHGVATNRLLHPKRMSSIPRCWPGPAMTRFSLTCSWITPATLRSIRSSRNISAQNVLRC